MATRTRPASWTLLALVASFITLGATSVQAEKLTIERLFAAPDLSGASLRSPQISPDGRLVAYLKGSDRDKDRLDLWAYDIAKREHHLLVDSARLAPQKQELSAEEEQRRERQRTSSLSGIVEYQFSPDSRHLLVPLGGDLYVYDLHAAPGKAVRRLTQTPSYETDAKFSPQGHYVSFIRDQNLVVYELASGKELPITRDGAGPISFGVAEFIAQEEMARTTGYWWSPDEKRIAFTRVDESPVNEVERFEIYADRAQVVKQRYPAAGTPNALVQLLVAEVAPSDAKRIAHSAPDASHSAPGTASSGVGAARSAAASNSGPTSGATSVQIDLGPNPDFYLARVGWFPDSSALTVQRQTRDQKTLTLLRADPTSGATTTLVEEHSDSWVSLNDNLTFLAQSRQFVWDSSRSGFEHLYLYDWNGTLVRPLTQGDWQVTGDSDHHGVRGIDEKRGLIYFMANKETPLERHLYSVSFLDASAPIQKITGESGWHAIAMSGDAHSYLDTFSTPDQPPSLTLRSATGSVLAELVPNKVTRDHPYAPYMSDHLPTEFGTLAAKDGQTLYYQIIKPRVLEPGRHYPVIVHLYGGPGAQLVRKAWPGYPRGYDGFFNQYLAQNGYIVFTLDNRGSGFRGVKFETALLHHLGSVEVEDQVTGVNFLKTLPYVDPARIGVFGWSYGGFMSLMCMMQAPDSFAAGVAGGPVTDWKLYDTHYTERYMGTPQSNADGYTRSSVFNYAGALRGPLLIMHGMADDNVLFTNSTTLFKKLQDLNEPFDIMTYPGAKHGLLGHADTGRHGYMTVKGFFDRTIGEERPR